MIANEAADRKLDIVMFGHTHRPCYEVQDGIVVLNPRKPVLSQTGGKKAVLYDDGAERTGRGTV